MNKEASVLTMLIVWCLNRGLDLLDIVPPEAGMVEPVAEFILMIGGALAIRSQVFSKFTLRKANLDPDTVAAKAKAAEHFSNGGTT
jgi:hypothetical protein